MRIRHVLGQDAPVSCDQLRIVRFSYIDFAGQVHTDGEIMVMAAVADHMQVIFDTLYRRRFPIARARLMDHYLGDDAAAMQDNNTSSFNHRPVTGGKLPSMHAYGLAIDLNPIQNPFIQFADSGSASYSPASGGKYANRLRQRPGKSARPGMAEEVVQIFADNGFVIWGGYWDAPIDYQHFQTSRKIAERMAGMPVDQARTLFTQYVARYRSCIRSHKNKALARTDCIPNDLP